MPNKALLLVDLQIDFLDGGALEVENSMGVIPVANVLQEKFDCIVATKDWHPADHMSFAANHPWRKPFQTIKIEGFDQILWPMHCVQGTLGSEFPKNFEAGATSRNLFTKARMHLWTPIPLFLTTNICGKLICMLFLSLWRSSHCILWV